MKAKLKNYQVYDTSKYFEWTLLLRHGADPNNLISGDEIFVISSELAKGKIVLF